MSRLQSWTAGVVLALVCGVAAGLLAGSGAGSASLSLQPSDRLDEAVASLRTKPFYVAPEMRHLLTDAQHDSITAALARADAPVHLLFLHDTAEAGYYIEGYLLDRVAAALGPGLYVVVNETMDVTQRDFGMSFDYLSGDRFKSRPADGLLDLATAMAAADVEQRDESDSDYWGGPAGGFAAGALFATGISIVLALLLGIVSWTRAATRRNR